MGVMASQITSLTSVYSTVYSGVDQRKHESSASLDPGEFPAQMASNAENVSIWWRQHELNKSSLWWVSEHSTLLTLLPIGFRTWLWRYTYLLLILMPWHRQRFSNRKETSCLPLLNAGFEAGKSETPNRRQTECPLTNRLSYQGSSKNFKHIHIYCIYHIYRCWFENEQHSRDSEWTALDCNCFCRVTLQSMNSL